MHFRLENVLSHLVHYRHSRISGVCLEWAMKIIGKPNGYFVANVYEIQNFSCF